MRWKNLLLFMVYFVGISISNISSLFFSLCYALPTDLSTTAVSSEIMPSRSEPLHYCIVVSTNDKSLSFPSMYDNNASGNMAYIVCWGSNRYGELGQGDRLYRTFYDKQSVDVFGKNEESMSGMILVSGVSFNCLLSKASGRIKCWGLNKYGQLGLGDTNNRGDEENEMGQDLPYILIANENDIGLMMSAGGHHVCAIFLSRVQDAQIIRCWGRNLYGEVSNTISGIYNNFDSIQQLACGDMMSCALSKKMSLQCWGKHPYQGQSDIIDIKLYRQFYCIVDNKNTVECGTVTDKGLVKEISAILPGKPDRIVMERGIFCFVFGKEIRCLQDMRVETTKIDENLDDLIVEKDHICVSTLGEIKCHLMNFASFDSIVKRRTLTASATKPWKLAKAQKSYHMCVVFDNKQIKCWGQSLYGELGFVIESRFNNIGALNEMGILLPFVNIGTGVNVEEVYVANAMTCILTDIFKVKCWGNNLFGQLGQGDTVSRGLTEISMGDNLPFINLGTSMKVKQLAIAGSSVCTILSNSKLKCWGNNYRGILGLGDENSRGDESNEMGDFLPFVDLGTGRTCKMISGGEFHFCAILDDDKLKCWGDSLFGKLGYPSDPNNENIGDDSNDMGDSLPYAVIGKLEDKFSFITLGYGHTFASRLEDGSIYGWGDNEEGVVGINGSMGIVNTGTSQGNVTQIGAGQLHTCIVFETKRLKCWGNGDFLGLESKTSIKNYADLGEKLPFTKLGSDMYVDQIVVTFGTTFVLTQLGIRAFGDYSSFDSNFDPNRGDGENEMDDLLNYIDLLGNQKKYKATLSPTPPPISTNVDEIVDIETGPSNTCVIYKSGKLKCFGANNLGQLGLGDTITRGNAADQMGFYLPYIDLGLDTDGKEFIPASVAIKSTEICATSNRTNAFKCWGSVTALPRAGNVENTVTIGNEKGEMGLNLPTFIIDSSSLKIDKICGGSLYTCAFYNTSHVKCWGVLFSDIDINGVSVVIFRSLNESKVVNFGQGITPIDISCGDSHVCVLFNNGKMKCWGLDLQGILGFLPQLPTAVALNATDLSNAVPFVDLGAGKTVINIQAGSQFTCALIGVTNGQIKCFGINGNGELGQSDTLSRGDNSTFMGDTLPFINLGTSRSVLVFSSGSTHSCAILDNNRVKCWGKNNVFQLGLENTANNRGDEAGEMGDNLPYVDINAYGRIPISISCGSVHTCVLMDDHVPVCWGSNNGGALGIQVAIDLGKVKQSVYDLFALFWKGHISEELLLDMPITELFAGNLGISGTIPITIQNATNLKTLDLSDNRITSIPQELMQLNGLQRAYLGGNNIRCDCKLFSWFSSWALNKQALKDWAATTCGDWNSLEGTVISSFTPDPDAPCFEPDHIQIVSLNSRGVSFKWRYDWPSDSSLDIHFDIDCTQNGNALISISEIIPWFRNQSTEFFEYSLRSKLKPFTNYTCVIYPVYELYDLIILASGTNPRNEAEAASFPVELRVKRRVRGPGSVKLVFSTPKDAPDTPPTNIKQVEKLRNQLPLVWDIPSQPNSASTDLFYTVDVNGTLLTNITSTTVTLFGNIMPSTIYRVRVQASNIYGFSNFSEPVYFETSSTCELGTYDNPSTGKCDPCREGFYRNASMSECTRCPEEYPLTLTQGSKSYSDCLTAPGFYMDDNGISHPCPFGGDCKGIGITVETMGIQKGFWRASNKTTRILACKHPEYCVGSSPIPRQSGNSNNNKSRRRLLNVIDDTLYCNNGHSGILCESCVGNKVIVDSNVGCNVCTDAELVDERAHLAVLILFLPLVYILLFVIFIQFTKSWEEKKTKEAGSQVTKKKAIKYWYKLGEDGIKGVVNILQICGLLLSQYSDRFDASVESSASGLGILSLDLHKFVRYPCLFSGINPQYFNMVFVVLMTIWIAICVDIASIVLRKTVFRAPGKLRHTERWLYKAKYLFLSFIHPSLCAAVLRTFQCIDYGDGSISSLHVIALKTDPTAICYTSEYYSWYGLALALSIIIIPSMPLYTVRVLRPIRSLIRLGINLDDPPIDVPEDQVHILKKLDLFYSKFKPEYYLSGVFILIYQLLITSLLPLFMLLSQVPESRQLIIILLVLVLGVVLSESIRPYKKWSQNISNIIRISLLIFIIESALLYGSDVISSGNQSESRSFGSIIFGIIVFVGVVIGMIPLAIDGIIPIIKRYRNGISVWDVDGATAKEGGERAILVSPGV